MKSGRSIFFVLKKVAVYTPRYLVFTVIEGVMWALIHSITNVLFIKKIIDLIETGSAFDKIASLIIAMAIFLGLAYLFHEWYWQYQEPLLKQKLHEKMQADLYRKAIKVDLECYDNADYYNDYIWALNEADARACRIVEDIGKVINRIISSVIILSILASIDRLIIIAIAFSLFITLILKNYRTNLSIKYSDSVKPLERRTAYVERVFNLPDYAKEIRTSEISNILQKEYEEINHILLKKNIAYGKQFALLGITNDVVTSLLFNVGIIVLLLYKLMVRQEITTGDFAASISAIWQLYWQLTDLTDYIPRFKENGILANKYESFINREIYIKDCICANNFAEEFEELVLKGISYKYCTSNDYAVRNLSLRIRDKEKIAIVGYNGAGKSTLIKLILRLYDPTEGSIEINGVDIKEYSIESYRKRFGVVFQDFQIYASSVYENIAMDEKESIALEKVNEAMNISGIKGKFDKMVRGTDVNLKKEIYSDGVELSGGEYQKIAIARAFTKKNDILILDEPSANLDPDSEYELNNHIMSSMTECAVIIISHRLSSVRKADRILMFENGNIIEEGNHEQLMKYNGKYAEMFRLQAEKYNV